MYLHLNNECQCYRIEERVESANRRTEVVNLNPVYRQVYSIQHYVIKFVSDLRQIGDTPVSSNNKTNRHDITEILLKVRLKHQTPNKTKPANRRRKDKTMAKLKHKMKDLAMVNNTLWGKQHH